MASTASTDPDQTIPREDIGISPSETEPLAQSGRDLFQYRVHIVFLYAAAAARPLRTNGIGGTGGRCRRRRLFRGSRRRRLAVLSYIVGRGLGLSSHRTPAAGVSLGLIDLLLRHPGFQDAD